MTSWAFDPGMAGRSGADLVELPLVVLFLSLLILRELWRVAHPASWNEVARALCVLLVPMGAAVLVVTVERVIELL